MYSNRNHWSQGVLNSEVLCIVYCEIYCSEGLLCASSLCFFFATFSLHFCFVILPCCPLQ